MRLTSFSNRDMKKDGKSTSKGILHDITMEQTDEGFTVTARLRHGDENSLKAIFTADNDEDAWDYAEAFERAITRELATTGIQGYVARVDRDKTVMITRYMDGFSHNGNVPDSDHNYAELDTRKADAPLLYKSGRYNGEAEEYDIHPASLDRLTWQADMAARDGLLAPRETLHIDEAAGVIGRFLERSYLGAALGEFNSYSAAKIPLPLLGKGTEIELCRDDKGNNIWKLHDKQLEAAHKEKSVASYNPPQGELTVASLYQLHQQLDDMAVQRNAGGWSEERYFRDMTRAASDLKIEVNAITDPKKSHLLPGEEPPASKKAAEPGLVAKLQIGRTAG